jgi:hypothetical protein
MTANFPLPISEVPTASCPVCSAQQGEILLSVEHAPVSCGALFPSGNAAASADQCRLDITFCSACGHVWNAAHQTAPESLYGDDYYSSFTASSQAQEYQESLAKEVDRRVQVADKTVVEIGCGDGFFLETLSSMGATAIGFEPSSTFELADARPGIQVHHRYFSFDGASRDAVGKADIVAMRHVLEHLASPRGVLKSIREDAFDPPGPELLLLEVPNAAQLLMDSLYFDFYNDHVQYFSYGSLSLLARNTGWTPLVRLGCGGEFLRLLCVNDSHQAEPTPTADPPGLDPKEAMVSAAESFRTGFQEWKRRLTALVAQQTEGGGRIAVWGAGARGVSLLSGLGLPGDTYQYLVDADPHKRGKFVPLIPRPICPPEQLRTDPVDCILVTSYTYFEEILGQLDWFRSQGGKVIRVYPTPELV